VRNEDINVKLKHIDIAISINCNLNCKMCGYREPIGDEKGLKTEDVFRLLRDAKELGLENISFSGGEALIRKDIFDIVSYAKELKINEIAIVTNGTLVNEENARKLIEAGITSVNISLEGFEPINDYIRGEGTYKKTAQAIRIFRKYQDRLKISVNVVISKYNYKDLFKFTRFLYEELGVKYISYSPLNPVMMGTNLEKYKNELVVTLKDIPLISEEIEKIISYSKEKMNNLVPESYLRKIPDYFKGLSMPPQKPCLIPSKSCGIDSAGNVFPCWIFYKSAGNIKNESLKDIVAKEIYLKQCEDAIFKKCKGCLVSCYPDIHESDMDEK
jgi:MoaA/NifB/PqqE/SkfB family radical SAM enzyme